MTLSLHFRKDREGKSLWKKIKDEDEDKEKNQDEDEEKKGKNIDGELER